MVLLLTMILLPHVQLVKFTSYVLSYNRVRIPRNINPIGWSTDSIGRFLSTTIVIKSLPTPMNCVAFLVTELALLVRGRPLFTASSIIVAKAPSTSS
jgi:hypothetical protein